MTKNLLIAGGDLRQIYCAQRLTENFNVFYTGFDEKYFSDNSAVMPVPAMRGKADYVVLPILPPDESGDISTPLFSGTVNTRDIAPLMSENAVIFTGMNSGKVSEFFPSHEIIAYMESEELALRNAIPTAEGAVMLGLENLPVTLNGTSVLIVGLGRIGTALAHILKGFGADITVAVRNGRGAAKAEMLGIKSVCTKDIEGKYRLVYNTVPNLIFTEKILSEFPEDTLFIELASRPFGIDMESAAKIGRQIIMASGLPGKTAPVTAGRAVGEVIVRTVDERG